MPKLLPRTAAAALLALASAPAAPAAVVTFYSIDRAAGPGGAHPNSDAARAAFLALLDPASVGVEDFEDNAVGSFHRGTHAAAFPPAGVTATITSRASTADAIRNTATSVAFPTSGGRFYYSEDRVGNRPFFDLTFDTPQTAIGFYGIGFSSYEGRTEPVLPVRLSLDGGTPIDIVNVDPRTIPDGSVSFFGLISDTPFTTVTLINTPRPAADLIGIDDILVGRLAPAAVPEPASVVLAGVGVVWLAAARRWRRAGDRPASRRRSRLGWATGAALALAVLLAPAPAQAGVIVLDFNQDGVLPSAQGMTYVSSPGVVESNVFRVSGGLLQVDTGAYGSGSGAYYSGLGVYDRTLPVELTVRAKYEGGAIYFLFWDGTTVGGFWLFSGTWNLWGGARGNFNRSDFHEFSLTAEGVAGGDLEFRIDGVLVYSGTLASFGGYGTSEFYFGDGSSSDGQTSRAQIDYLIFRNIAPAAVPEPGSAVLAGVGAAGLAAARRRRRTPAGPTGLPDGRSV